MRHARAGKKLGRDSSHRRALYANLAGALIQHGRIETTEAKAKAVRPYAEKLIGLGKRGDLHSRRLALAELRSNDIVHHLFLNVAPRFAERNGGYTRIVRIGHRLGDAGETGYLELMKSAEQREQERQARIAAAEAKALAQSGDKVKKKSAEAGAEAEAAEAAAEERPRRGRKKELAGAGSPGGGSKQKRTGPRKVGS